MASQAERRAARRRLAREIKTGTYQPSAIGKKARQAATELEKERLIDRIQALKHKHFGDRIKYNETRSRKNIQVDPATGKLRTLADLRSILDSITRWDADGAPDDWEGLVTIYDGDHESAFYYH